MRRLIINIGSLVFREKSPSKPLILEELRQIQIYNHAYLLIENGHIHSFGPMASCNFQSDEIIDAQNGWVLPAFCDSHTHIVFAKNRANEFVYRLQGLSYQEIAEKGGGILNSAQKVDNMSEDELFDDAQKRLLGLIQTGTGAIEIKSGYGLNTNAELKMLRVIRRLKDLNWLPIKASFLGAHAMPKKFLAQRDLYLHQLIHEMLPQIADEGLADYMDVFCEKGFYTVEETDQLLEAASRYGLKPKIHCNQFHSMGAIEVAIKHRAVSVDHLEVLNENEMALLSHADTIATLLPSAPFFLHDSHRPPVRKMIEKGIGIALASDYNPGTSPSGNMSFVWSLACIQLRMLPEEAFHALTINGAFALEWADELGSISKGKKASLYITKPMESLAEIPYYFGESRIRQTIIGEKIF